MYHVYHTEGLITGGSEVGDASRVVRVFTRDLGLVYARVQGIRLERSKLRYALQDYSLIKLNLVKGRGGWRLVSAEPGIAYGLTARTRNERATLRAIAGLCALLERLVAGEEKNSELYRDVISGICFLRELDGAERDIGNAKLIIMMKMLHHLGYWKEDEVFARCIKEEVIDREMIAVVEVKRSHALTVIERALTESQL